MMLSAITTIKYSLHPVRHPPNPFNDLHIPQQPSSKPTHAATESQTGAITEINYQLEGHLNTHPEKKMTPARD